MPYLQPFLFMLAFKSIKPLVCNRQFRPAELKLL